MQIKYNGLGVDSSQPTYIDLPIKECITKDEITIIDIPKKPSNIQYKPEQNKESILDKIDTGFGDDNTLHKECPKPKFTQHLSKENFLSEFKSASEKQQARDNLEVYSKAEIDVFIKNLTSVDLNNFITKDQVTQLVQNLDYVKSEYQLDINYNIPKSLFKQ